MRPQFLQGFCLILHLYCAFLYNTQLEQLTQHPPLDHNIFIHLPSTISFRYILLKMSGGYFKNLYIVSPSKSWKIICPFKMTIFWNSPIFLTLHKSRIWSGWQNKSHRLSRILQLDSHLKTQLTKCYSSYTKAILSCQRICHSCSHILNMRYNLD